MMTDRAYVSNLTSRLKSFASGSSTSPTKVEHVAASSYQKNGTPKDDLDQRYLNYNVDGDIHYATNNEINVINSELSTHQKQQQQLPTGSSTSSPYRTPPTLDSNTPGPAHVYSTGISIQKDPTAVPLADSHPEMFSIPAYSQTPVATPVQTPSVQSSYNPSNASASNSFSKNSANNSYSKNSANNSYNKNSTNNSYNKNSTNNSFTKNSANSFPSKTKNSLPISARSNTLAHGNSAVQTSPHVVGSFKVGGAGNDDSIGNGDTNKTSQLTKILSRNNHALANGSQDGIPQETTNLPSSLPVNGKEGSSSGVSSVDTSHSSNDSSIESSGNAVETPQVHIKGIPALDQVKENTNSDVKLAENVVSTLEPKNDEILPSKTDKQSSETQANQTVDSEEMSRNKEVKIIPKVETNADMLEESDYDNASVLADEILEVESINLESFQPDLTSKETGMKQSHRPSSPSSIIGNFGYKNGPTRLRSKRLSAISFAKNIINLSVYNESDSEPSVQADADVDAKEVIAEAVKEAEGSQMNRSVSRSKQIFNNKVRPKSFLRKKPPKDENPTSNKSRRNKDYPNKNVPSNFSMFMNEFVKPNCEIVDSFKVLEPEELENDSIVYNPEDEMITNGKLPIKRSTSFLNGFKFLSKSKPEPAAVEQVKLDINDAKYSKKIYRMETEELIKVLKYWNYDYTLPEVKEMFPYLHNLELNNNQFNFFKNSLTLTDSDMHKQDLKVGPLAKPNDTVVSDAPKDTSTKLIPLPNSDKYLLLINTNDFYEYDDSKDIKDDNTALKDYIKNKYYIKGSISPWDILDFDEITEKPEPKKRDLKVRFSDEGDAIEENEEENGQLNEELETYGDHRYIKLNDEELIVNGKQFTGCCKPLNSLKRMNRIKNSDNGEQVLAHNLYNKKVNLRNYNFQQILLFKIAHVVIYNNDNNMAENLKFAKIFGLLQKKIFLQEEVKLKRLGLDQTFTEADCYVLNYDGQKLSEFDINHYNENESAILGLVTNNTKFESVDIHFSKSKEKYNFDNKSDLAKFLSTNPFLVPYSSSVLKNNLTNWNKNYLLHEKFENWLITSGVEIYTNIHIGNIIDYNNVISNNRLKVKKQTLLKLLADADAQTKYILRGKLLTLQQKIDSTNNDYRVLINCTDGVDFPKVDLIESIYRKADKLLAQESDLIYLPFPSSGSFVLSALTNNHMLSIINFMRLLHYLSVEKGYKVLIYCYDGFTHLSLLSLLLEIFNNFTNVNNAIMKYYLIYERYVYWFKIDYEILNFLQSFLLYYSPNNPDKQERLGLTMVSTDMITSLDYTKIKQWYEDVYCSLYNFNCFEYMKIFDMNKELKNKKNFAVVKEVFKLDNPTAIALKAKKDDWFDIKNDNNLPSKILPYLYLGGINHLNSQTVLELLNISFVITIGEKPTWLNISSFENQFNYDNLDPVIKNKLLKDDIVEIENPLPFVKKLIYLPNVQDNGIDPFEPYFLYLLKALRKIREQNDDLSLQNKVLVNCKVGVSRSASLCIAEVMNFLKISLPRAYLYVRVRRLNLIIQPNLKIFYNLLELEEMLTIKENIKIKYINLKIEDYNRKNRAKKDSSPTKSSKKKKELSLRKLRVLREVDWHILCKEIDLLNSHYIKT